AAAMGRRQPRGIPEIEGAAAEHPDRAVAGRAVIRAAIFVLHPLVDVPGHVAKALLGIPGGPRADRHRAFAAAPVCPAAVPAGLPASAFLTALRVLPHGHQGLGHLEWRDRDLVDRLLVADPGLGAHHESPAFERNPLHGAGGLAALEDDLALHRRMIRAASRP